MIEPQTDLAIYRLFLWRCVECRRVATEINHIETRASTPDKKDDWRNKVPMCHSCHDLYHQGGVDDAKINHLKEKRAEYLALIRKAEYI